MSNIDLLQFKSPSPLKANQRMTCLHNGSTTHPLPWAKVLLPKLALVTQLHLLSAQVIVV